MITKPTLSRQCFRTRYAGPAIVVIALMLGTCPAQEAAEPVTIPALQQQGMADAKMSLNFSQTDIQTVLKTVGNITGINFLIDERVQGKVTVISPTPIRLADLYGVLESILEIHGYAAVPAGNLVKIVPKADAVKHQLPVRIGSNPDLIPVDDSLVTQIMPLQYADAEEVLQIIQSHLSGTGSQADTYARTNAIVVTDTSSRIHSIATIIKELDVAGAQEQTKVFMLQHASANGLAEQIQRILQEGVPGQPLRGRVSSGPESQVRIQPDPRTNALLVYGKQKEIEVITDLVTQLDIPKPPGANDIHVVYLKNAQAKEVAESLNTAAANLRLTGDVDTDRTIQVSPDEGTNALIINAHTQDFNALNSIIEKLDIVREQVLVEMLIVEVSESNLDEIGVDWQVLAESAKHGINGFAASNFGIRVDQANLEGLSLGLWKSVGDSVGVEAVLNAIKKYSGANILSTPQIMTSNHQPAKIVVGENRPFVVDSRITETDPSTPTVIKKYEYKDVGITLDIVPHVSQGGMVRLEIDSEFTKLIEDVSDLSADTPTTAKRQAQTVITMKSGSTVVIGGLIRDDKTHVQQKVPLLGDLPGLGALFRHQRDRLEKTNLLIFITPHVMDSPEQMHEITQAKREQMDQAVSQGREEGP